MNPQLSPKAPYSSPRLVVYGDVRLITQNMMMSGADAGTTVGATFSA